MNKKILVTITLLMMAILSTIMVSAVQASKTTEVFYVDPVSDPPTLTNTVDIPDPNWKEDKVVANGRVEMKWGGIKRSEYDGPLGSGFYTRERLVGVYEESMWDPDGEAWSINKATLEIVSGDYGTGTLTGKSYSIIKTDWNKPPPKWEMWSKTTLNGKLFKDGESMVVTVLIEGYTQAFGVPEKITFVKTTIVY